MSGAPVGFGREGDFFDDALEALPRRIVRRSGQQITWRNYTHQAALVYAGNDGYPTDLRVGHVLPDIVDILILVACSHFSAHYLVDNPIPRIHANRRGAYRDVAVGDDYDQTAMAAHRQSANLQRMHPFRGKLEAVLRRYPFGRRVS